MSSKEAVLCAHWLLHALLWLQVRPWVVDITCDLKLGDATNVITYHGLYEGKSPKPDGQPGFIMMQSNVVFFM